MTLRPPSADSSVVILIPALQRPHRVAPLLQSIVDNTPAPHSVLFICDPDDLEQQRAVPRDVGLLLYKPIHPQGPYASKINAGVRASIAPLIFLAADDLHFHPGWLEAARAQLELGAQVVGVNDLIRRRRSRAGHATHFLMTRDYAQLPTVDGERGPLYEGYHHWHVDDELIATARKRGVYAYAPDSRVEHLHPVAHKAPDDATYARGRSDVRRDRRRFAARRHLLLEGT